MIGRSILFINNKKVMDPPAYLSSNRVYMCKSFGNITTTNLYKGNCRFCECDMRYEEHYYACYKTVKCFSCRSRLDLEEHDYNCIVIQLDNISRQINLVSKSLDILILRHDSINKLLQLLPINKMPVVHIISMFLSEKDQVVSTCLELCMNFISLAEGMNNYFRRLLCMQPIELYSSAKLPIISDSTVLSITQARLYANELTLARKYAHAIDANNSKLQYIVHRKQSRIIANLFKSR